MKLTLKNISILVIVFILGIVLVGCSENEKEETKKEFNEVNYQIGFNYELAENYDITKVKEFLDNGNNYLKETKSYSYTQTLKSFSEEEYTLTGVTKIDVTGGQPLASMELTGNLEYSLYVKDNKAYLNMNGEKTSESLTGDLSDLTGKVNEMIGSFVKFESKDVTENNLIKAGVDKHGAVVINYNVSEMAEATIIMFDDKIMKVLYTNLDSVEFSLLYDYNKVEITFPTDLDSYKER